ncbi:MAG: hypothetical protein ACTSQA_01480 [Candidatus Heimdallarchaeaceae archaeon]
MQKKGIALSQAFGAVLTVVLIAVLVIIAIFLFVQLSATFTDGSSEANASDAMVTQFANYVPLVGLVGTVIFLGLVIGVLVASFAFGRGGRV